MNSLDPLPKRSSERLRQWVSKALWITSTDLNPAFLPTWGQVSYESPFSLNILIESAVSSIVRASNRIASKQHHSISYADDDRRGGVSDSEDDYSDAMEEDEDDWDEDDYRRAPRNRRRNGRRKPSYQQTGRSRATSGVSLSLYNKRS